MALATDANTGNSTFGARYGSAGAIVTCAAAKGNPWSSSNRVAHMIAGNARTLYDARAYQTIQTNFIEAFGGIYNTFVYLKLEDDKLANVKTRYAASVDEKRLADALRVLAPTDQVISVKNKDVRNPKCNLVGYRTDLIRLVAQLDTLRECFRLVEKYEAAHGMKFDWITRLRPDTVIAYPIKPMCFFDSHFTYLPGKPPGQRAVNSFLDAHFYIDHAAIMPRDQAPGLTTAYDEYANCHGDLEWRYQKNQHDMITDIQAYLLWQKPGRKFKIRAEDIPVVLFREDRAIMKDMCGKQYNGMNDQWKVFDGIGPALCENFLVKDAPRTIGISKPPKRRKSRRRRQRKLALASPAAQAVAGVVRNATKHYFA